MYADRKRTAAAFASVVVVAGLVFVNSLGNGFALDDVGIIENNEQVHGLKHLAQAVTGPYWPTGASERGLYRPLTLATFAVDWEIGGGSPFVFHLVNLLLHAAVSALVLALLLGLGAPLTAAWAGAVFFAVHPVHVEAVANVVGRGEILAAGFVLGAGVVFVQRSPPGWYKAIVIGLLYLLGLLAKENAIVLPALALLYHLHAEKRVRQALAATLRSWRVYVAFAAALTIYFVLRRANIGVFLGVEDPPWYYGMPDHARILTAIRVWPEYLRLMILPMELVPDYGPGVVVPETSPFSPLVILGVLTALVAGFVAWRLRTEHPLVTAGIVFFVAAAVPVMGILFPVGVVLAERTLYLPSVGASMVLAGVAEGLRARPLSRRLAPALFVVVVVAASVRTWTATPVWKSSTTVMNHLLAHHAANYRGQWALASSLKEAGDTAAALDHFELATRMVPGYHALRVEYGRVLAESGHYARAAAQFDTALQIIPHARQARASLMDAHLRQGQPGEAVRVGSEGNRWHSDDPLLQGILARALARSGRFAEAVEARSRSIGLQEQVNWAEWGHLAGLSVLAGDTARAAAALEQAREVAPEGVRIPLVEEMARLLETNGTDAIPLW